MNKAEHAKWTLGEVIVTLKWLAVGPVLITLGVTNAIFSWTGNSLAMRIFYSAAAIVMGLLITCFMIWVIFVPEASSPVNTDETTPPHHE